jgi:4-amino-4-deoxy-L-arabinose transferase-like glycosyltransferase
MTVIDMEVIEEPNVIKEIIVEPPAQISTLPLIGWLTVERALYGLLLLMAVGIRFLALDQQPLNALEAANAWPAWLIASAVHAPDPPTPTSPLLYTLHTLLFWLAGGSDALARSIPALAGVGLVWLLWYWRSWLGRPTALLAALLFAIDPWMTAFSRLADGASLSVFFGLLTLIGLTRLYELSAEDKSRALWQNIVAASAGLLVVSGAQAWSFLLVLGLFVGLFGGFYTRPKGSEEIEPHAAIEFGFSRSMLIIFMAAVVLGATSWLVRPEGLGLISTSLTVWFGQLFGRGALRYPLSWPFLRLLMDEPLLLAFGLIGLAQLWLSQRIARELSPSIRAHPWQLFLTLWLFLGLLLALLPGRNPFCLLMIGLPLLLATAHLGDVILRQYRPDFAWREVLLVVLMLVVLLTSSLFGATAFISHRQIDATLARTTLIVFGLALLLVVAFAFWSERTQTRFVMGSFVGLLLLIVTIASSWQLNQQFDVAHPQGFFAEYTHPDMRRLAMDIATLSAQRNGDPDEAPLQVQMAGRPDAVLGWYLRNMRQLTWVLAPGATNTQTPPLVVTLAAQADARDLLPNYMGSHYDVHVHWLPPALFPTDEKAQPAQSKADVYWTQRARPFLRWLIYREATPLPPADSVALWVPAQASK